MWNKCYLLPTLYKCNAECIFCSTKTYDYNNKKDFLSPSIKFRHNMMALHEEGIRYFEITGGGEPFLNADLPKLINIIKDVIDEPFIKIYTNGSMLNLIPQINEINISRVHWDETINEKFMGIKFKNPLREIVHFYKEQGISRVRLAIPLLRGGIDTREKLDTFIEKTNEYIDGYVVRPLSPRTRNLHKYYIEFKYSRLNVNMDFDFSCLEPALILGTNNKFYSDWELKNEIFL